TREFPVFSGNLAVRDRFAHGCLLQRRVWKPSVPLEKRLASPTPNQAGRALRWRLLSNPLTRRRYHFRGQPGSTHGTPVEWPRSAAAPAGSNQWSSFARSTTRCNVRVAYIRERSIMNPAAETVQAKALRMLQVIYERTQSGNGGIDIEQVRR